MGKNKFDEIAELMTKIEEAMSMSKERQDKIDEMKEELHSETAPVKVEEKKKELASKEQDKKDFDEMTIPSVIRVSTEIEKEKETSRVEYNKKMQELFDKKLKIQKRSDKDILEELNAKKAKIKETLGHYENRFANDEEKLQKAKDAANKALEDVDKDIADAKAGKAKTLELEKVDNEIKNLTEQYNERKQLLNGYYTEIDNYAEMLGIADKVREARILKPEPEQQGKGRQIKKGQQVPTNGKHKIVISAEGISLNGEMSYWKDIKRNKGLYKALLENGDKHVDVEAFKKLEELNIEGMSEDLRYALINACSYNDNGVLRLNTELIEGIFKNYNELLKNGSTKGLELEYNLKGTSSLSLLFNKELDKETIKQLKDEAYNARGYANIEHDMFTKIEFKVRDIKQRINNYKQKKLNERNERHPEHDAQEGENEPEQNEPEKNKPQFVQDIKEGVPSQEEQAEQARKREEAKDLYEYLKGRNSQPEKTEQGEEIQKD